MSAPGPFETGATEAYYNITLVDPDWTGDQKRQHLTYFNHAGLLGIPKELDESARALGLPSRARLRLVELPLALPAILAGVKTAAVLNVGTATLGALVGAGGYGEPILTGIRLDDTARILEGAIPAALLALLAQWFFDLLERLLVSKGLRS